MSLLDIHVDALGPLVSSKMEILEAGTGHGSLTLHLARAIHAANGHLYAEQTGAPKSLSSSLSIDGRGAIVHTLDISESNSKHAQRIVSGFRRGMYAGDVEYHVGNIAQFIKDQQAKRETQMPFLDCVVLDLPGAHEEIKTVCTSIKIDGTLAMFCPQITQITDGLRKIHQQNLPLFLDQVVELGSNYSAGRKWDVRLMRPRNRKVNNDLKAADVHRTNDMTAQDSTSINVDTEVQVDEDNMYAPKQELPVSTADFEVICRPRYGELITAGGFLAIWKRKSDPVTTTENGDDIS